MKDEEQPSMGILRSIMSGDIDVAKAHLPEAKRMVSALRRDAGIDARMQEGQPGGYFKLNRIQPDGTTIEITSNNGMDSIIITAKKAEIEPQPESPDEADFVQEVMIDVPLVEGVTEAESAPEYAENEQEREEEKKEEEEKKDYNPYLWIGVRTRYDMCQADRFCCMPILIEPAGGQYRGALQPGWGTTGWFYQTIADFDVDDVFSLGKNPDGSPANSYLNLDGALDAFQAYCLYNFSQHAKTREYHCLAMEDDFGLFFHTMNGLRLYDVSSTPGDAPPTQRRWQPYDPWMSAEQNEGLERDFSARMRVVGDQNYLDAGWDQVFVLDPAEEDGEDPVDDRRHILNATDFLVSLGMEYRDGQVLSGDYLFSVMAWGSLGLHSRRAGEAIPGFDPDTYRRGIHGDYDEYMVGTGLTPLVAEVEIRLGKPDPQIYNYLIEVETYSMGRAQTMPFGLGDAADWSRTCNPEAGLNQFGPNYSHPMLAIDVENGTVGVSAEPPLPFLGGGTWSPEDDGRRELRIFIYGGYFPACDPADYPAKVAESLFLVLEGISSGVFGDSFISEVSQSELEGIFAGANPSHISVYDPMTKTKSEVPIISAIGDYDYTDTWFHEWWYWYYPYFVQTKYDCMNSFALLIQSTPGYVYDGGQNLGPLAPAPDCC